MEKKLYPIKFHPIASRRPWGGNLLVSVLGKSFTEEGPDGSLVDIPASEILGESWEIADMGREDSVIANGFLAGSTIGEIMETYFERVVGDEVFEHYGTQFPLLIKFLDIEDKLSVQVHPDDTVGAERYDSLGKKEVWYVVDAKPGAKIYMGFKQDVQPREFYDACKAGTAQELLNVIEPKKGDVILINPGTVHAADGGILVCEIQESSDLTFRLYDWGRELNPATARKIHLEEAFDLINFGKYNPDDYTPASKRLEPESGKRGHRTQTTVVADCPEFTVNHLILYDGMHIYTSQLDSFIVYCCIKGEVSLQMADEDGITRETRLHCGDTVLVPAECPDFVLSPIELGSELLESTVHPPKEQDSYVEETPCAHHHHHHHHE